MSQKKKLASFSDEEVINLARYSFRAAHFYQKNVEIEFMINKMGVLDMYELQIKPGMKASPRKSKSLKKGVLVKGLSACPGRVRGKVRVIKKDSDLEKILSGEIVVIHLPKADICLSIFRKASAVITDCGGITSHFASLARDFNIPCIVGTERATQVLKDKMVVVVDASKGEVRLND